MTRVLSGIQPTGTLHLGNYLGALARWVEDQRTSDSYFTVVDLHGLTIDQDPPTFRNAVYELCAMYLACGIDPEVATVFVQSHVAAHSQLAWVMECTVSFGELSRMTQFKDKSQGKELVRAGLFTYPALMAADILLYQADEVPVGDDQKQHLELARDLAIRFNTRYGEVFRVPSPTIPKVGARILDLTDPTKKMSKSSSSPMGLISLDDDAATIERKIMRAVTDTDGECVYRPDDPSKAGLSNLLEIFGVITDEDPSGIAARYERYGDLKRDLAAALIAHLAPIQERFKSLIDDRGELDRILAVGAHKARSVANDTLSRAYDALGLIPPID
ncbi:MAG: tryptophan--tRNA ligase [Acidimicrobiales bacterium]